MRRRTNDLAILRIAHMLKEVSLSMRVIDMFRTPAQQEIIRWLETNHMGTRADIAKATGIINSGGKYYRHFRALVDDGVIHICGYVGRNNIPVYALCSRRCP